MTSTISRSPQDPCPRTNPQLKPLLHDLDDALAVAHSQLVTIWHVLTTQTAYHDLGGDYFLRRENPEHRRRRAIDQLQRLGYRVTLELAA